MNTPSEPVASPSTPQFTKIEPGTVTPLLSPIPASEAVTIKPTAAKGNDEVMSTPAKTS